MDAQKEKTKRDFRQDLTSEIVTLIENGTAPWQKPWHPDKAGALLRMPLNATTGRPYRGGNSFWLMLKAQNLGSDDPRWCTFKQAEAAGWKIKKGSKGTSVEYWQFDKEEKRDNPTTGETEKIRVKLDPPRVFYATVFHASQVEGMPELPPLQLPEGWNPVEEAERIITGSGAQIFHDQMDRAFYSPDRDEIHLPPKGAFPQPLDYYEVALHELAHWSGHPDRLKRDLSGSFGSERYAREELRAQMASLYLSAELGVPFNPDRHAAYQGSWVKALKADKNEIFRAARDAEVIADYIRELGRSQTQEITAPEQEPSAPSPLPEAVSERHQTSEPIAQALDADLMKQEVQLLHRVDDPGILRQVVDNTPIEQVKRMLDAINDTIHPINTTNPFWQRHQFPLDIDSLQSRLAASEEILMHRWDTRAPHEMTLAEFAGDAVAEALENHGRKWQVTVNGEFVAFSDANTEQEAVAEAHANRVNNALASQDPDFRLPGSPALLPPPPKVLAEYPDLVEKLQTAPPKVEGNLHSSVTPPAKLRETIRRSNFEGIGRNEVQEAIAQAVEADPDKFIEAFKQLPQSLGGRFISADTFKETFEPYRASNEARNLFNTPVHNAAAVLASEQLRRVLQEEPAPGANKVALLTGIHGAGKTSSVLERGALHPRFHAVYEGQLSDPNTAMAKVNEVLAAGFTPVITVIHQPPEQALDNTLRRFEEIGRGASINTMAKIQGGLPESLATIQRQFGDKVELLVLDRANSPEPQWQQGWGNLSLLESEGNYEQIKQRLEQHLEASRARGLSDDAYRQAAGLAPIVRQRNSGIRGGLDRQHETPVDGREAPGGNRPYAGVSQPPRAARPQRPAPAVQQPQPELVRETDKVKAALQFISPDDRQTWVRMAMAVRNGLGDDGFDIWNAWSQQAETYRPADAKEVWRSAKTGPGIGLGTLYFEAKREGFDLSQWRTQAAPLRPDNSAEHAARDAEERRQREVKFQKTAAKAQTVFDQAQPTDYTHPYLVKKGVNSPQFIDPGKLNASAPREMSAEALKATLGYRPKTDDTPLAGRILIIPVTNREGISTLEFIDESGRKSALAGGKKAGSWYAPLAKMPADPALPTVIVEGVSTAMSTHMGLNPLGEPIKAYVVAALSDTNMKNVALAMRELRPEASIVIGADAISNEKSDPIQTAHDAAAAVDGKFFYPSFEPGLLLDGNGKRPTDFNDLATLSNNQEEFCADLTELFADAKQAIPGKKWQQAQGLLPIDPDPPTTHQEKPMSDQQSTKYTPKAIGEPIYKSADLPADLVAQVKERYGARTSISTPKENGTYAGEVYDLKTHLVQEVSARSVVIHDKAQMGFKGPTESAHANSKLDGWELKIFYDGKIPTAYPHDRQKEQFEIMVASLKKSARELGKSSELVGHIDELAKNSWQRVVEGRKKSLGANVPAKAAGHEEPARAPAR